MVKAMTSYRYLVEMRSAALRKMLARSAKGVEAHDSRADRAASIADWTWGAVALEYEARGACEEGLDWVRVAFLSS